MDKDKKKKMIIVELAAMTKTSTHDLWQSFTELSIATSIQYPYGLGRKLEIKGSTLNE